MLNSPCLSVVITVSSIFYFCNALERILGGRPALPGEFPMMAGIVHAVKQQHRCGAILVSPRYLLSAAHCLNCGYMTSCNKIFRIVVGDVHQETSNDNPLSRQLMDINTVRVHPGFDRATFENDIGIIVLLKEVQPSIFVQSAHLKTQKTPPGTDCTTIGWGISNFANNDELLATSVKILRNQVCQKKLTSFKNPMMICAGDLTGKNDSCMGDSGGPLICGNYVVGIVSFGINCAMQGYGAAYTNVSYYQEWVRSQLAELEALRDGVGKLIISINSQFLLILVCIVSL